MITAKANVFLSLLNLSMPTGRQYLTSYPVAIDQWHQNDLCAI